MLTRVAENHLLAYQQIPWYAILCLPILLTADMTFMDTTGESAPG